MSSKTSSASNGGWINSSSSSSSKASPSSIESPRVNSSFFQRKQIAMQELPLDWTRVKRRRRVECTIEYNPRTLSKSPLLISGKEQVYQGQAIFCLHDSTDPTWFQGYFVETALGNPCINDRSLIQGSRRPWGLLATKEEVDECMECENGGFRRIAIKILKAPSATTITGIDWTGGDMMRLSNDKVEMNTQRLLTGKDALPYLKQYFMTLMRKLQQACEHDHQESENRSLDGDEEDILEMLPDVAVLIGEISMVLRKDEDDLWGE